LSEETELSYMKEASQTKRISFLYVGEVYFMLNFLKSWSLFRAYPPALAVLSIQSKKFSSPALLQYVRRKRIVSGCELFRDSWRHCLLTVGDTVLIVYFMFLKINKTQERARIIFQQPKFVPKVEMSSFLSAATLVGIL